MALHRTVTETPPFLPPSAARQILAKSKARQGVRLTLAVLLLSADGNGVVTGYTREIGKIAGWEHEALRGHLLELRRLGELDTIRSPTNRVPGMWRINALA